MHRHYSARNKNGFVCSICQTKINSIDLINEHVATRHYDEYLRELKSDPRGEVPAEEWRDPNNPLKCNKCDFVAMWPFALQQHAISHVSSYPFKCFVCSHTFKRLWDLVAHFDQLHAMFGKNPYKKKDREAARKILLNNADPTANFLAILINAAQRNLQQQMGNLH